jgi:shikimate dehydrogenase
VLGDPVQHSRSPAIHNAAIAAAGIDAVYVALRCSARDVPGLLTGLARANGGGNVTVPHKGVAAEAVERPSARVRATRACNTFWLKAGKVHGENTDVTGFSRAVNEVLHDVRGARVLIVGAGGAARAALYALLEDGAAGVTVLGRRAARAREIAEVAGRRAKRVAYVTREGLLRDEGFDLVVNATPLGLAADDATPLRFSALAGLTAVFDMTYRSGGTAWVRQALANGIPAIDGTEMLIQQAAAAFEIWFDVEAPVAAMRAAIRT